jgi:galactose mutarotase-like enzyme
MNTFEHRGAPKLHIESIKTPEGNEVSFCPERGGIITSIKFGGKEILYLDEDSLKNLDDNVRGGVPILFPNAGPNKSPKYPKLLQHGIARTKKWWKATRNENEGETKNDKGFVETLKSDSSTREAFPYDFSLRFIGEFYENGSFNMNLLAKNLEKEKDMPVSFGLHPYFKVANEEKKNIKFNFKGGKLAEDELEKWANGKYISIDNPKTPMEVEIPGVGTLILEASEQYEKIWIWSKPGKDFICIEPVMRDEEGLVNDPERIKPGDNHSADFNIRLKE